MAEVAELTLANICLDVQIGICMCLHPTDILALRKTCKALQPSTRQRVVWEAALLRACIDNTLFLPSFPISDMSDLELERAAMAPTRWIEFCRRLEERDINDPGVILRPRTRSFDNSIGTELQTCQFFIVPGGRYLVIYSQRISPGSISVLDLRYSSSGDCKLIASVGLPVEARYDVGWSTFTVQATPDGLGLIIFLAKVLQMCTVYEIYPQSETPHLSKIAHQGYNISMGLRVQVCIIPGAVSKVVWYSFYRDRIIFRVWDYQLNHSISFSVDVELKDFDNYPEVIATKTAVIVLCEEKILIWAIPHLLPQPPGPEFFDHNSWNPALTNILPLFTIPLPDDIDPRPLGWKTMSPWYLGSSNPLYFEMLCPNSIRLRFRIMLKPDLSSATLHLVKTLKPIRDYLEHDMAQAYDYKICEDFLFSCRFYDKYDTLLSAGPGWSRYDRDLQVGFTRFLAVSHSGPVAKVILPDIGNTYSLLSCPASGTFVVVLLDSDQNNSLVVFNSSSC